jgi:hypothetical protein
VVWNTKTSAWLQHCKVEVLTVSTLPELKSWGSEVDCEFEVLAGVAGYAKPWCYQTTLKIW